MKKIGIIFAIILTLLAASYSGFWFYRSYNFTKGINNLTQSNSSPSSPIAIDEISTSGFPLSQNITLKNITLKSNHVEKGQPNSSSSAQIILENIDLKGTPFSSNFTVENIGDVIFKDLKKDKGSLSLRFSKDSKIFVKKDKNNISFDYTGSEYQILNQEKKVIFSIKTKNAKSSLLFGDIVKYKYKDSGNSISDASGTVISSSDSLFLDLYFSKDENKKTDFKIDLDIKNLKQFDLSDIGDDLYKEIVSKKTGVLTFISQAKKEGKLKEWGSFKLSGKLSSTPNEKGFPAHLINAKLNRLEFSNSLFKISLNGAIERTLNDFLPSGELTLKIENFDSLIRKVEDNLITLYFEDQEIVEPANDGLKELAKPNFEPQKKSSKKSNKKEELSFKKDNLNEKKSDLSDQDIDPEINPELAKKLEILDNINLTMKDLGDANPISTDNLLVFDIYRDPGSKSDIMINGLSLMQVIIESMSAAREPVRHREAIHNPNNHL